MSTKENEALVRNFFESTNKICGGIEKLRTIGNNYIAPGFVAHYSTGDMNQDQYLKYSAVTCSAIPDLLQNVEDVIVQGDKVVARISLQGIHKGNFGGIPATGRKVNIHGAFIFQISQNKIAEVWAFPDEMGILRQMVVISSGLSRS